MTRPPTVTDLSELEADVDTDPEPRVVDLADEGADDVLGALSSATARELLKRLRESPAYPAALADDTGTSVQNVHYHLAKLEEAGAVEVVDTVYSEKGREMNVYAPAAEPLVLVSGSDDDREALADTLAKLLGAVGVLALGSVAAQELVERLLYPGGPRVVAGDGGQYASPPMTNVAPPVGLYVFAAGLAVLVGWFAWRRRRRGAAR